MTKTTLPVALVQERNRGDADANLAHIEARVAEAAASGALLVLLQELHNGPYFCQHQDTCEFDLAEPIPGPSTTRLGALAKQHGVVLVVILGAGSTAGLAERDARAPARWAGQRAVPTVTTPALVGDKIFGVSDRSIAYCLDAKTGETAYQTRLSDSGAAPAEEARPTPPAGETPPMRRPAPPAGMTTAIRLTGRTAVQ